jgi:hypothetical protein
MSHRVSRPGIAFLRVNDGSTIIRHTVRMPNEYDLTLRQVDQLRTDITNVESSLVRFSAQSAISQGQTW